MNRIRKRLARLVAPVTTIPQAPRGGQLMVVRTPPVQPVLWDPRPHGQPGQPPTVFGHYVASVKKRVRMGIDGNTARAAIPTLRVMTEQAKLATEYQSSLNALSLAELEREIRVAELEQRKLELAAQRRQHQQLEQLRLQKEQLSLQLDIATMKRQIREQRKPPEVKLTPAQQKVLKKTEIEEQLQQLRAEEARALNRATSELEKRRLQNMYANRRDRLMERLEEFL